MEFVENEDKNKFTKFILENTSSLGLRATMIERYETQRNLEEFISSMGKVNVKFKYIEGIIHSYKVEHEDIMNISSKLSISPHIVSKKLEIEINNKYNIFS